jgi:hypothetical protein
MITDFDDYLIHQSATPISQPSVTDRNFYDRYWFNGYTNTGDLYFGVGFGRYPHRFVQDGHLSIVVDGIQHSFHASGRAPEDPRDAVVGPMKIEIVDPMRVSRVVVEPNDTGIECDLRFHGNTPPHQEPKNVMFDGTRLIMDTLRFTQFGRWEGHISIRERRIDVTPDRMYGTRDKSWGVRPIGEFEEGAPSKLSTNPGVYFVWMPLQFNGFCTHYFTREEPDGYPTELSATRIKSYSSMEEIPRGAAIADAVELLRNARHAVQWVPGTRWPRSATVDFDARDGAHHIELEPLLRFHMMGIGYQHAEWRHALWHDELALGVESWRLDEVEPDDFATIHCQTVCRATMGEQVGIGVIESLCYGPHEPSGFEDFFDGYEPD